MSWLACALFFPHRRHYDLFLTEGPQFPPLIMKRLGLLQAGQRVAALMDNETLYFLRERRYSRATCAGLLRALESYDALLCVGQMQTALAAEVLATRSGAPRLLSTPSGISVERLNELRSVEPRLDGGLLVFVGNGPGDWRGWYKGLDLTVDAAVQASVRNPAIHLHVAGEWETSYIDGLRSRCSAPERVTYLGRRDKLAPLFESAVLYLHLGRGEAFGISILEALCAGLPCIVSEWTGAKEVVQAIDPRLVVPLDAGLAAERVLWYLDLPVEEKRRLSVCGREAALRLTEPRAANAFALNVEGLFE